MSIPEETLRNLLYPQYDTEWITEEERGWLITEAELMIEQNEGLPVLEETRERWEQVAGGILPTHVRIRKETR